MSDLTARRERLVNPFSLLLIGLVFIIAFVLLLPGKSKFIDIGKISRKDSGSDNSQTVVDDLDFAYLKARSASGEVSNSEMHSAINKLLDAGDTNRLEDFLKEFPNVELTRAQRLRRDYAKAVTDFADAGNADPTSESGQRLRSVLENALSEPELHTTAFARRSIESSKSLVNYNLVAEWYDIALGRGENIGSKTPVALNVADERELLVDCGKYFGAHARHYRAIDCLSDALLVSADADEHFQINLLALPSAHAIDNPAELDAVVTAVLHHKPKTSEQLEETADSLLAIGRPDLAYPMFAELASQDTTNSADWLYKAARWAEASSEPDKAAEYIQTVMDQGLSSDSVRDEKKLNELWIAAGENERALEQIFTRLDVHPNDTATLRKGVTLARGLNLTAQAGIWNAKLLEQNPDDVEAINTQVTLALAAGNLPEAERWANVATVLEPEDITARRQLAQVTEWNGRADEALQHWQWVARKSADAGAYGNLVRLGKMVYETEVAADAALTLARMETQNEESVEQLIEFQEATGQPGKAVAAVRDLIKRQGATPFLLSRLARLHMHHSQYTDALAAWDAYEAQFKPTTESRLARTELNWRLGQPEKAFEVARQFDETTEFDDAKDYQIRLLSELAWRYDEPALGAALEPALARLEDPSAASLHHRRKLSDAIDAKDFETAFELADRGWIDGGDISYGLTALDMAVKVDDRAAIDRYTINTPANSRLRQEARYWALLASSHIRNGELDAADDAYAKALAIEPRNPQIVSGFLWQQIGSVDDTKLLNLLERYTSLAETEAALWSAYALGYLRVGDANTSLRWFSKLVDTLESDYSLMLTFADALEGAGQVDKAFKVRQFAVAKLRPILLAASHDDKIASLRQYATLVTRYAGADAGEQWTQYLVSSDAPLDPVDKYWREDVGIAWLMSTQRHEHARVIMARLHEDRIKQPAWQTLALALHDKDHDALRTVLASGQHVSVGNRILALATLGKDRRALRLSEQTLRSPAALSDRRIAEQQYVYLRGLYPGYTGAVAETNRSSSLTTRRTGLQLRHSFSGSSAGVGVEIARASLSSDRFDVDNIAQRDELILTLSFGGSRSGGQLSAGIVNANDTDVSYTRGRYFRNNHDGSRSIAAEFGFNEPANQSPALQVAALQNRTALEYQASFGTSEYIRLRADANELFTRVEEARIARGLSLRGEVGTRGSFGSNIWSSSVALASSRYDREDQLPDELQLAPDSSFDNILAERFTSLGWSTSLARGGINSEYPQVSSPRYYINSTLGYSWPENAFGVQLEGGIGFRVLGGDELSLALSHDTLASELVGGNANSTGVSVNYRYHFGR